MLGTLAGLEANLDLTIHGISQASSNWGRIMGGKSHGAFGVHRAHGQIPSH